MQVLKDEIRKRVLESAEDIFFEKGFRNTTMRTIAKEVGISVSNLYLYYDNKEALFYAITECYSEFLTNGFQQFLNHQDAEKNMISKIVEYSMSMISTDWKKFILIMDKSQGTKLETTKQQFILALEVHMVELLSETDVNSEILSHILAKGFWEGIIEIVKQEEDEDERAKSIQSLIHYHMNGIACFL